MAATRDIDSPAGVLAAVQEQQHIETAAEIEKFKLAVEWAIMHPVESLDQAATVDGSEGELTIAGPGAPLVAEFCVADLALALKVSTDSGRLFLGDAIEVRYRLPRLWKRVLAGKVPVWKARKVAQATKSLPVDAARFVDRHVAPAAHRCSLTQIERTVEEARARFDPAEAEERRLAAADARCFDVHTHQVSYNGTVDVIGTLDLADALDLNDAITTGAQQLGDLGSDQSLDVRRSMAAGLLARGQDALDLTPREIVIHVHETPDGLDPVARVENTRTGISVEQVAAWCHDAKVTIKPVIDLNTCLSTTAYRPTDRLREHVVLMLPTCVFPLCNRPSRSADLDHTIEWPLGPTDSWNLAPLCRFHHRLKTHSGWTYQRTGPLTFEWTSPHGITYVKDFREP